MKTFVLIFGGLGAILLVIAGIVYFREASFLNTAEKATGTVTDFNLSSSDDGGSSYCPVIDFTTSANEPVKYFANVCASPPAYEIGEKVDVLYDPQDIKHVQMNGFWSKYVGVVVLGAIGVPFFLLGVWGMFQGRPKPAA